MSKKKAAKKVPRKTSKIEGDDIEQSTPSTLLEASNDTVSIEIVAPIETGDEMNDLAMRIWEGQSISLPITERVKRIKASLTEKGYDTSTLTLPVDDKYLG